MPAACPAMKPVELDKARRQGWSAPGIPVPSSRFALKQTPVEPSSHRPKSRRGNPGRRIPTSLPRDATQRELWAPERCLAIDFGQIYSSVFCCDLTRIKATGGSLNIAASAGREHAGIAAVAARGAHTCATACEHNSLLEPPPK